MSSHTTRANRLARETSPYLLQHAHNPVDWYPWGTEALQRAREDDRPIFLSIGYSACHWCHVMERESFENDGIAGLMNRHFVNIKVDREERPDLDDVYMAAVQAMTGSGGWPMSVFLTPQLEPFFGGTYFPPEDRHGMPGFPRVLEAVADAYRSRRAEVSAQGRALAAHLRSALDVQAGTSDPERGQLEAAAATVARGYDPDHGGFGGAPKFPAPMTLEFLLRSWRRSEAEDTLRMVTHTLDRMAAGGIYDQLGGGFARYATDAHWLVPHFEKMLYDNALLAHCYLEAFRATGRHEYRRVATETLDFMVRELQTDDGGLASALDADSEGEEGRFYVWSHDEFMAVLRDAGLDDDEARLLAAYWGVSEGGNWEGHSILRAAPEPPLAAVLARGRAALFAAREGRVRPGRDDKQLAAWNGMALRAVAVAALVLGDERYVDATRRLAGFVESLLLRDDDRLWRTVRDGSAHTPGFAEDYANVADGLLAAYASLGQAELLRLAERLVRRAIAEFWDDASGTFFDTGSEHDALVARPRSLVDSATPAANSVMADVMLRLAVLLGDEDLDRRARAVIRAVAQAFARQPSMFGRMLAAADRALGEPVDAVVTGDAAGDAALVLRRAAAAPYAPDLVIAPLEPGSDLEDLPLFAGKAARDGKATAYVCRGYACDEPTHEAARVRQQVERLAAPA
jgi:uncharacterized protein